MFGTMFPGPLMCWYQHGASMRLIEPGKPNQIAHIESFNGRLRDECLSEHWFLNLAYAQAVIEAWRREYNEEQDAIPLFLGKRLLLSFNPFSGHRSSLQCLAVQLMPILKYETAEGSIPLDEWLADLKDRRAKARVMIRLDRLELGLEGHWHSVGDEARELKIPEGKGGGPFPARFLVTASQPTPYPVSR